MDDGDVAVGVLLDARALEEAGVAEAHFAVRREAEELLGRILHEVVALDEKLAREGNLARAGVRVLGVVDGVEPFDGVLGEVVDHDAHGVEDAHAAEGRAVEVVADAGFEKGEFRGALVLGDADLLAEVADGLGGVAAAAEAGDGRHAGVVPAVDELLLHELEELALRHDRVVERETRELALLRADLLAVADDEEALLVHAVDDPAVKRAVHLELKCAERVRDAFGGVLEGVREVVGRIGGPLRAGAVVRLLLDAVDHGVAEVDVGRGHVDLRAEAAAALVELALAHALEEVEVLLDAPVAVGARGAGLGRDAAVLLPLLLGEVADVGLAVADEGLCELVHAVEQVGGVEESVAPVEAEPAHVLLDGADVVLVLLGGVGVVHAEVAGAVEELRHAEVDADGLGVADVEIAVWLGREARDDGAVVGAGGEVVGYELLDKVAAAFGRRGISCWIFHCFSSKRHYKVKYSKRSAPLASIRYAPRRRGTRRSAGAWGR